MSFQFGNVVVVNVDEIGVIVKSWADDNHYVYSKELSKEQMEYH